MKAISILLCFLFSFTAQAIEVEELIQAIKTNYALTKKLEYFSTYELYKGHRSEKVHSTYQGYVYRNEKQVYQKINNTELIYGNDFFLKINHKEKAIALDLAQININREVDLEEVLKNCESKTIEEKEDHYQIRLDYNTIASSPFSSVEIRIDEKTKNLIQMDLYYATMQDFSTHFQAPDLAQAHLKISFHKWNKHPKEDKSLFEFENYMATTNSMLSPTGKYKGYELVDNRLN